MNLLPFDSLQISALLDKLERLIQPSVLPVAPSLTQLLNYLQGIQEQSTMERRLTFGACKFLPTTCKYYFAYLLLLCYLLCHFTHAIFMLMPLSFCRGCILFAMVCGSLPYGDDTQVAQMIHQPLEIPRPLSTGEYIQP